VTSCLKQCFRSNSFERILGKGKRSQKQKGKGVVETTQSEPSDITLSKDQVGAEAELVAVPIGHVPDGDTASDDQYKETGKGKWQHAGGASDATKSKKSKRPRRKQMGNEVVEASRLVEPTVMPEEIQGGVAA